MTRTGRPLVGTAADAGWLDGRCDAINERACNPSGRWRTWHPGRPTADWTEYETSYRAAYKAARPTQGATA